MSQPQQVQISKEQLEQILKQQGGNNMPVMNKDKLPLDMQMDTAVNFVGGGGKQVPFVVQAKDCVDESHLHVNISANLKLIDNWVVPCTPTHRRALIVSAGPSTLTNIELIRKEQQNGTLIVCVKHSLPMLMDNGIIPDSCVILDPRDIDGISTHGILRKDLFGKIDKKTIFLIASMTNPSVTKHLKEIGATIVGWNATVANIHEWFKYDVPFSVMGGSCSAVRAVSLYKILGISDFDLIGFDCCFYDLPKDVTVKLHDGRPKYMKINVLGQEYLTTGELVALVQDFERMFMSKKLDVSLEVLGDGIIKAIYDKKYEPKPTYEEMLEELLGAQ